MFSGGSRVPEGFPGVESCAKLFKRSWVWRYAHKQPQFPPEGLKLAAHAQPHDGWVGELVPQELGAAVHPAPLPEPCSAAAGIAQLTQDQRNPKWHLRLSEVLELALPGGLGAVVGQRFGAGSLETAELKRLHTLLKEKPRRWHNPYQAYCTSVEGKADIQAELDGLNGLVGASDYPKACSAAWRKIAPEPKACVVGRGTGVWVGGRVGGLAAGEWGVAMVGAGQRGMRTEGHLIVSAG